MVDGDGLYMSSTLCLARENVKSLPNLVVAYLRNFSLLFRKVLFTVLEPIMSICSFNSSVLLVYNDTVVTIFFPSLFFFLCLAFQFFPFPLLLVDLGTSGVLDSCLSSMVVEDKGSFSVIHEGLVISIYFFNLC